MAKKSNKIGFFSMLAGYCRRAVQLFKDHNAQFVIGLLFAAVAIYLCSSFISFFTTGGSDQTVIEEGMKVAGETVGNTSGRSGAVVAEFLINGCFGWASLLMLPLLALVAVQTIQYQKKSASANIAALR